MNLLKMIDRLHLRDTIRAKCFFDVLDDKKSPRYMTYKEICNRAENRFKKEILKYEEVI